MNKQQILRALEPFTDEIEIFVRIGPDVYAISEKYGYITGPSAGEFQLQAIKPQGKKDQSNAVRAT